MPQPQTRYARAGESYIAYQVVGEGPIDLIYAGGLITNVDLSWDFPEAERFLMRLASFSRLILFDRRGSGLSDRPPNCRMPTAEDWAEDLRVVMETVGSSQAAIFAERDAGPVAMIFAANHPEKVSALILANTTARYASEPDYPCGQPPELAEQLYGTILEHWGTDRMAALAVPSRASDENFARASARFQRSAATPRVAAEGWRYYSTVDVRDLLADIRCPTLVMHRSRYPFLNPGHAAYLQNHIAGARGVGVEGEDVYFAYDRADESLGHIEEFLTGSREQTYAEQVLLTVLFVDISGSTELAARIGDSAWRDLLERFHGESRKQLQRFHGREVDTSGDGFFATFDNPSRALRCAVSIREEALALGLTVRAGLHAGECELAGAAVRGLTVHIGARVLAEARPGEVWLSRTIRDLVVGTDCEFKDEGSHELKGVPGHKWRLYSLDSMKGAGREREREPRERRLRRTT
ncbi:MAG: adenylate/guanylate cyclase domain-containing protein [Stenotrophobium sp.]